MRKKRIKIATTKMVAGKEIVTVRTVTIPWNFDPHEIVSFERMRCMRAQATNSTFTYKIWME